MQRLARELHRGLEGGLLLRAARYRCAARAPIGCIADQRMPDMREMDADLMRAPRLQPALEQRSERLVARPERFQRPIARACRLASLAQHRHALPVERVAPEIALDQTCALARRAPHDGVVCALHLVRGELLRKAPHRALVL